MLVLNQTRVMNARCFGVKENGVRIETFVLDVQGDPGAVPVMLKPARRAPEGTELTFPKSGVRAVVVKREEKGRAILRFPDRDSLFAVIDRDGELPLPPYIKRDEGPDATDAERYQTIFAQDVGAVAAPTAGLHFTEKLLVDLQRMGVELCFVTHHVGIGTFKPLVAEDIRDHVMEAETYIMSEAAAETLNSAKREGDASLPLAPPQPVVSNPTMTGNASLAGTFSTNLFIYPGFEFRAINGLTTNFHLPGSSLILLVSALVGRERVMEIYREAISLDYRFYSFGDAMLLTP